MTTQQVGVAETTAGQVGRRRAVRKCDEVLGATACLERKEVRFASISSDVSQLPPASTERCREALGNRLTDVKQPCNGVGLQ